MSRARLPTCRPRAIGSRSTATAATFLERSPTARTYLEDAYRNLQVARTNGYPSSDVADLSSKVLGDLDIYYHVNVIVPQVVLSFGTDELGAVVLGPDGAAYVVDQTDDSVYRVDLVTRAKRQVAVKGEQPNGGGTVPRPCC